MFRGASVVSQDPFLDFVGVWPTSRPDPTPPHALPVPRSS